MRATIAAEIMEATSRPDVAGCSRAWKVLLLLDRLLFNKRYNARGGKHNKSNSSSRVVSSRIRKIWEGRWDEVWAESCDALVLPGQGPSKPQQERLRLDADLVRGALQGEDVRAAMRIVDGKVDLAPEAKATKVLLGLFPAGAAPICADFAARFAQVLPEGIEKFLKLLTSEFQHAQLRRGAGPGGSIVEFVGVHRKGT